MATTRRSWSVYAGLLLTIMASLGIYHYWSSRFDFDDAYMYTRYAYNLRHGWGIAWNPHGPHTFGITSLPWLGIIFAGSYVFHDSATLLTVASSVTGLAALLFLSLLITSSAKSSHLKRPAVVFSVLTLSLLLNAHFGENWCNGMETMLGMFAVVALLAAHERFRNNASISAVLLLALVGTFCVLVRPELLLIVLTLPVATNLMGRGQRRVGRILLYAGALGLMLAVILLGSHAYFGTSVPLAFYLKAMHGYEGFRLFISPFALTAIFFSIALPFLIVATLLIRKHDAPTMAPFVLSVSVGLLYLATVTQIMGGEARYYIPLLPLVILPSSQLLDEALASARVPTLIQARVVCLLLVAGLSREYTQQITWGLARIFVKRRAYSVMPRFDYPASVQLPALDYWNKAPDFARNLPAGTTMAASEVGLLGSAAPQMMIIDLAGLNNIHLAQHPGDVRYVLSYKPDVLWLPHSDYTRFYGALASTPELLQDYDLYAGALNFGLAIRRSSLRRPDFSAAVRHGWDMLYPGYRMQDYKVQQVHWDPGATVHGTQSDILE